MPDNHQTLEVQNHVAFPDDEIQLIDLLRILWNWKYLIIGGAVVCAIVTAIISYNMKKIYSVEMVLRPGILRIVEGRNTYINSATNVRAFIESGAFSNAVISRMSDHKSDIILTSPKFKVTLLVNSDMLKVVYETPDIELGKNILRLGVKLLQEKYSHLVKYFQEEYEIQLNLKNIEREMLLLSQQSFNKNIKNIENRITDLRSEIESFNKNTGYIIRNQQKFLSRTKDENDILIALVYSNTIQQNISHASSFKNRLNDYEIKLEQEKRLSVKSEWKITKIVNEIEKLEFKKNIIENIQILQPPTANPHLIRPKKLRNVILVSLIGLFLMVFLSFLLEYIFKALKQNKTNNNAIVK